LILLYNITFRSRDVHGQTSNFSEDAHAASVYDSAGFPERKYFRAMYIPVALPAGIHNAVRQQIRNRVDPLLTDVHAMLRLPIEADPGLDGGCNLSAALVLLSVVAGLSAEVYRNDRLHRVDQSGNRFRKVLADYYPWNEEAALENAITHVHAANILYEAFRNPLAHSLGVFQGIEHGQLKVAKGPLEEREIEEIERADARPNWDRPTLYSDSAAKAERTKTVLTLKHFYWGVRKTIYNVVNDLLREDSITEFHPMAPMVTRVSATAITLPAYSPERINVDIASGSTHRVDYEPEK
jgi:hypothetical protein